MPENCQSLAHRPTRRPIRLFSCCKNYFQAFRLCQLPLTSSYTRQAPCSNHFSLLNSKIRFWWELNAKSTKKINQTTKNTQIRLVASVGDTLNYCQKLGKTQEGHEISSSSWKVYTATNLAVDHYYTVVFRKCQKRSTQKTIFHIDNSYTERHTLWRLN